MTTTINMLEIDLAVSLSVHDGSRSYGWCGRRSGSDCADLRSCAWVEHVFGAQTNDMRGTLVRNIGILRAKAKIGIKNIAYNMRRLAQLRRLNPCPA